MHALLRVKINYSVLRWINEHKFYHKCTRLLDEKRLRLVHAIYLLCRELSLPS